MYLLRNVCTKSRLTDCRAREQVFLRRAYPSLLMQVVAGVRSRVLCGFGGQLGLHKVLQVIHTGDGEGREVTRLCPVRAETPRNTVHY